MSEGTQLVREKWREIMAPLLPAGDVERIPDKARAIEMISAAQHFPRLWLPDLPGVYVLDDESLATVLYVGESKNLRHRLRHHERHYLYKDGARLRVVFCRNHKRVEKWLIDELRPTLNGVSEQRRRWLMRQPTKSPEQADQELGAMWDQLFGVGSFKDTVKRFGPRRQSA